MLIKKINRLSFEITKAAANTINQVKFA